MISPPVRFLFSLVGINLLILLINLQYKTFVKRELPAINDLTPIIDDYRFTDTSLAYKALTQLDIYKPIPMRQKIPTSHLGLKMDDHYCAKQRAYFVEYPEEAFEQMNLLHSWPTGTFVADTFATVANDLHGAINRKLTFKQKEEFLYEIKPETTCFFTTNILALYFNLTKHASCLFQASNQIPGQTTLALKDVVAQVANAYVKGYEDRPHCINHERFFPQSWLLSDPNQCKDFFKKLLSPEYAKLKEERKIVYIKKIAGTHRGEGVQPLNTPEELKVREQYKDGLLCGSIRNVTIMQHYIHNALLLHGHKFDFRMYLLIASTNPLIAYYHDGFLRVTLAEYDAESTDKKVLLTNLALNQQIYDHVSKGALYQGKTEEQLKNDQQWNFDRLQSYLLISGVIQDPNWLDNYLRPELKKAMIHLVRLSSFNYAKHSSFYGLYGVDFMLDKDLNLWFIEANSGPAFDGYSQPMAKFISKMLTDHLEIVYGLLRSRMKRTISFINKLIADGTVSRKEERGIEFKDFERNLKEFEYITMNYFEDEFKVSEDNGFSKIIDENEHGIDVYQRLIPADCL